MTPQNNIGVAVIATSDEYVTYAISMLSSLEKFFALEDRVVVTVFTDLPSRFECSFQRIEMRIVRIAPLVWPEASLLRYKLMSDFGNYLNQEVIFYADADLLFLDTLSLSEILPIRDRMSFVRHPGYFNRSTSMNLARKFVRTPWENRAASRAHVPMHKRKVYVAGGFWGGPRSQFMEMVSTLKLNVEDDLKNKIYAKSFDESHINWWITRHSNFQLLTPKYLFAEGFSGLNNIENPKILAVRKSELNLENKRLFKA